MQTTADPTPMASRSLAALVRDRRDEILARWADRVRWRLGEDLEEAQLLDSLPRFLDELALALERGAAGSAPGGPPGPPGPTRTGAAHGEQRARLDVNVEQLVWEYGVLRDVVLELAEDAGVTPAIGDFRILADAAAGGIAAAAARYVEVREETLRGAARAEAEARRAQELLDLGDAFFEIDRDWRLVRVNSNQEKLSRKPRSETIGRTFWEVWPDLARPETPYWQEYHRVMDERVAREFDAYYPPLDLWTAVTAYPVSGGGMAVFFRDATARKRAERERAEALAQLREEQRFQQQLMGIVSHDLRNPLNAVILGAAALLGREDLPDRHVPAVARVRSAAERAARLIRDLLDVTAARLGGGIPVQRRDADLAAIAAHAVEELQPSFPDRAIRLVARGSARARLDPDRMAQVVGNLLANALKYGPPGTPVTVELSAAPGAVTLRVHNAGEPIPPELLRTIFDPWQRGARAGPEPEPWRGVGLGLFIVDRIVAAHGGRVEATSSADGGTVFTIELPRGTA